MSLLVWAERPREEAYLFNPAFCATSLHEFVKEYQRAKGGAAPFPLLFCVLPITLHGMTRQTLPGTTLTSLYSWRERNPQAIIGFTERARSLRPVAQEALRFAIDRKILTFADGGSVILGEKPLVVAKRFEDIITDDARDVINSSRLLGRWFAKAGPASMIMAAWGIKP